MKKILLVIITLAITTGVMANFDKNNHTSTPAHKINIIQDEFVEIEVEGEKFVFNLKQGEPEDVCDIDKESCETALDIFYDVALQRSEEELKRITEEEKRSEEELKRITEEEKRSEEELKRITEEEKRSEIKMRKAQEEANQALKELKKSSK